MSDIVPDILVEYALLRSSRAHDPYEVLTARAHALPPRKRRQYLRELERVMLIFGTARLRHDPPPAPPREIAPQDRVITRMSRVEMTARRQYARTYDAELWSFTSAGMFRA